MQIILYVGLKGRWEHKGIFLLSPMIAPCRLCSFYFGGITVVFFLFFLLWCQSVRKKEIIVRFHVHLSPLGGFVRPSFCSSEIMSVQALQLCGLSCCLSPPAGFSVFVQRQTWGPTLYLEYSAYVLVMFLPLFLCSGALWMAIRTSWG